ncbi:Eae protein [Enterobacter asburiae]|uniref:Eae protein n=1 Tax=Enterobacter asburiae TaxID=61645 RepID=UPI003BF80588
MFANSIRYMLIASVRSQYGLLQALYQQGTLSGKSDTPLNEARALARYEGINYAASRLAAAYNHGFIDKPQAEVFDVVRMILTAKEDLANDPLPAVDGLSGEYADQALKDWAGELSQEAPK